MLDRVFDQRLQQHTGHYDRQSVFRDLLHHAQLLSEPDHFDVEIVIREGKLFFERHERVAVFKQDAQDIRQLHDHLARQLWLGPNKRGNRVERVKQEVRVNLALQRVEMRLYQQAALLFQLPLGADGVPYLQRNADYNRRTGADGKLHQPVGRVQFEVTARIEPRQHADGKLQRRNKHQQHDLTIEVRTTQIARDPLVEAQVDHRRERPDIFAVRKTPVNADNRGDRDIDKQSAIFAMRDCRQGEDQPTEHRCGWPQQQRHQNGRFKGEVGRIEVRHANADIDAQRKRQAHDGQ